MMTTSPSHTLPFERTDTGLRRSPLQLAAVATVGLTGAVAAIQFGGTDAGPELCVVRGWTGGWCPGCGGARAAHHLLHGELGAAWTDHPWVVLAAVQVVVAVVALVVVRGWTRRSPTTLERSSPGRSSPGSAALAAILLVNAGALLAIWFVRVATGAIPGPWSA